jgi:dihydroorotate dehydrogenase
LRSRSTEVLRYLHQNSGGRIPIVSVGGIMTAQDAVEKIQAGASLVQVYTGMIYQGPAFVKEIKKALVEVS